MKINLRKASVVQQIIVDEIKRIGSEKTEVNVSLFDAGLEATLDAQLAKILESNNKAGRLLDANRYLRAAVAKQNAQVGITDYLAEEAFLASAETRVKALSELTPRHDILVLTAEITARKTASTAENARASLYGHSTYTVEVNVVPANIIADAKAELETIRRRRRKIKDEMVSINVRTEFEVPGQIALVLAELGLD